MPLVKPEISIDYTAQVNDLIKESNKVISQIEETKRATKEANRETAKAAKEAEEAVKKNTMSWTDFRSMYQTVLDVVRVGQAVWGETGQKFIDNAVAVGDMARMMGTSTEEASRLKEVADDTGVSFDSLARSLKLAAKDGFEPSIDSLAKMADEYNALAPGVERTQFLLDRFGKSGDEMGKLLEKGSSSIREMSAAMDESLIVTQEGYEQARQYQISMDALKDSWDAFTYDAAPPLIAAVTKAIDMQRDLATAQDLATEAGKNWWLISQDEQQAFKDLAAASREQADAALLTKETADAATGAFEDEAEATKRLAEETKEAEAAVREITKANQEYLDLVGNLSDRIDKHREKEAEIQAQLDSGKITLEEAKEKWRELADEQEDASRRMILNMLEQQLAVDGLSEKESNYLLETGLKWGVYSQEAVDAARQAQAEVNALTNALNNIPTEKNVTISTYYQQYGNVGNAAQTQPGGYGYQHAAGGSFMIPNTVGGERFPMPGGNTASGGERVTVTPENQSMIDYKKFARILRDTLAQAG